MKGTLFGLRLCCGSAIAASAVWLAAAPAQAQERSYDLDIPSQTLDRALKTLARATHTQVTFDAASVSGKRALAIRGHYTPRAALDLLLKDSGLVGRGGTSGLIIVRPQSSQALKPRAVSLALPVAQQDAAASGEFSSGAEQAPAAFADTSGVQDIVVTAQRRTQMLTDVGVSVAVVSGETLQTRQIATTEDLAVIVPGLAVGNSGFGTPIYSLRGIGVNELSIASGSSVAVYVDEVPLTLPVMTRGAVLDLERLEVLKGPQGTLYGQNATGGAINYISNKPTDSFEAGLLGSYGRYNSTSLEGFVSGPLAENLKGRVAARVDRRFDGWQKSVSRPGDTIGEVERYTGRAIVQWEPTETLRLTFNANGWIDKSDNQIPQLVQWVGTSGTGSDVNILEQVTQAPSILPPLNRPDNRVRVMPNSPRWADWDRYSENFKSDDSFWQTSLRADLDISEQTQLTSITAFMKTKMDGTQDPDGIGTSLFPATLGRDVTHVTYALQSRTKSFVQELRATSDFGPLNWIVGANYQDEKVEDQMNQLYTDFFVINNLAGVGFERNVVDVGQTIRSWSIFTNAEYKFSDQLSVSGGIRYSEDRRRFSGCTRDWGDGGAAEAFNTLLGLTGTANEIQPGGCYSVNAPGQPGLARLELKQNNIPWNINVNFHPMPRSLIYGRVSKGFKAGNFPTATATSNAQFLPVTQESVLAYEAGFKLATTRWLTAEGAVFYYDYSDKQQRGRENVGPPFGLIAKQVNVPKSSLTGAEIAITLRPVRGLTISASDVYVKTKVKTYCGFNIDGQQVIIGGCSPIAAAPAPTFISGASLPFVSKHSVNLDIRYETPVGRSLTAFVGGNMAYRSRTTSQIAAGRQWDIAPYTLFDAQIGVESDDNRWRAWLWGKNITNKLYWNNVIKAGELVDRYVGMGSTYGISASMSFR